MPIQTGATIEPLRRQFRADVQQLLGQFWSAETLQHAGAKGSNREEVLRRYSADRIPRRFQVATGTVVDAEGSSSGQQDIVIADALYTPVLLPAGPNAVFPIESVHCVIEVRSRCVRGFSNDITELAKRFGKLMALSSTEGTVRYTPPFEIPIHGGGGEQGPQIVVHHDGMFSGTTSNPWRLVGYRHNIVD
jgi:uncharacterized protein DUF6602